MKTFFNKHGRFENILTFLFALMGLVYGIIKLNWLGISLLIITSIIILIKVVLMIFKNKSFEISHKSTIFVRSNG